MRLTLTNSAADCAPSCAALQQVSNSSASATLLSHPPRPRHFSYTATKQGKDHYLEFLDDRRRYLEPAMKFISGSSDFEVLNASLRALSGAYEQAARSAASAKGI